MLPCRCTVLVHRRSGCRPSSGTAAAGVHGRSGTGTTQRGYDTETADAATASVFSIRRGQELEPDEVPRPLDEQRADAERVSMRALGRKGVSESEMRQVLTKQDLDPDVVEHEVARLVRVGLLDDVALATGPGRRLHERKGLAPGGRRGAPSARDRPDGDRRCARGGGGRRGRRVRPRDRARPEARRAAPWSRPGDRRATSQRVPHAQGLRVRRGADRGRARPRRRRTATSSGVGRVRFE